MTIYKTRYQANKERRGGERVVKVCGGYAIMAESEYQVWRRQK